MGWMVSLLIVVQVICAAAIIILVLLQHGKGADMGAAFGGGASGSLFGASGSANFLSRSTGVIAAIFFVTTIGIAYSANSLRAARAGLMSNVAPAGGAAASVPASQQIPQSSGAAAAAPGTGPMNKDAVPAAGDKSADKSANIPK
jgi:preprotein translocase subunit SecG